MLTDEELNQLMSEVSRQASPKHSRAEEPALHLSPVVCRSPRLTVPTRTSITPAVVQGSLSTLRSHSIAGSQLRSSAHSASSDSRALSADAGQTVHRVHVLPLSTDEGRVRRSGSMPTKPTANSGTAAAHRNLNKRKSKIHTISKDT